MKPVLTLCAMLVAVCGPLVAATHNVSTESELRNAITQVNASADTQDEIILAPGTYQLGASAPGYVITKTTPNSRVIIRGAAGGSRPVIDGGGSVRLFHVQTAAVVTVEFRDLDLRNGRTNNNGSTVAEAWGGGVLNKRAGTSATNSKLEFHDVAISACIAMGEDGADGTTTAGQPGAPGKGGAIYCAGGGLKMVNCTMENNSAWGGFGGWGADGNGGSSGDGKDGGRGGDAFGGAIYMAGGVLMLSGCAFTTNAANGDDGGPGGSADSSSGTGGRGGNGGDSGSAFGGALYIFDGSGTVSTCTFTGNGVTSGNYGGDAGDSEDKANGADGGACGDVQGGALFVRSGSFSISDTTISTSEIISFFGGDGSYGGDGDDSAGRNGGKGGNGGVAQGGGVYVDSATITLTRCTISGNLAWGGDGGYGGDGGSAFFFTGSGTGGDGGDGGDGGAGEGGGLYAYRGSTTLFECTISNNTVRGGGDYWTSQFAGWGGDGDGSTGGTGGAGGDGGNARGGGVYFDVSGVVVNLHRCTINGNVCEGGDSQQGEYGGDCWYGSGKGGTGGAAGHAGDALGGGIYRAGGSQSLQLVQCTISGNFVVAGQASDGGEGGDGLGGQSGGTGGAGGDGGLGDGAGVYLGGGTLSLYHCTVASNEATSSPGGIGGVAGTPAGGLIGASGASPASSGGGGKRASGTLNSDSTIWWGNSASDGPDFSGAIAANYSLFGNTSGATITGTGNRLNQNANLGALANNGGSTMTRLPGTGTQAIDNGNPANPLGLQTDQRAAGYVRNYLGQGADIGAVEVQPAPSVSAPVITVPAQAVVVGNVNYAIEGTAPAGSTVRAYVDANGNGVLDGTESATVAGQHVLAAAATAFSVAVALPANAITKYLLTAEVAALTSAETASPDITHDGVAPSAPAVTSPATALVVSVLTFNIGGSAEADSLVKVYADMNQNGVLDTGDQVANVQQLGGGATAFSISVSLGQSQDHYFLATATDAAGNESPATVVPVITHQPAAAVPAPVVTNPVAPVTVDANTFVIQGTATAGALVRIYTDANGDGLVNGTDSVAGSHQLGATETAWSVQVSLAQSALNRFTATADDGVAGESAPAIVPTITEQAPVVPGGNGGGGGGGGGCAAAGLNAPWLMAILPALAALCRRRRQE